MDSITWLEKKKQGYYRSYIILLIDFIWNFNFLRRRFNRSSMNDKQNGIASGHSKEWETTFSTTRRERRNEIRRAVAVRRMIIRSSVRLFFFSSYSLTRCHPTWLREGGTAYSNRCQAILDAAAGYPVEVAVLPLYSRRCFERNEFCSSPGKSKNDRNDGKWGNKVDLGRWIVTAPLNSFVCTSLLRELNG